MRKITNVLMLCITFLLVSCDKSDTLEEAVNAANDAMNELLKGKEHLVLLKKDNNKHSIVLVDDVTGKEELFVELPEIKSNESYTSLCYSKEKSSFFLLSARENYSKNYKLVRVDVNSKKVDVNPITDSGDALHAEILTDEAGQIYLYKEKDGESDNKSSISVLDIKTGKTTPLIEKVNYTIFAKYVPALSKFVLVMNNFQTCSNVAELITLDPKTKAVEKLDLTPNSFRSFAVNGKDIYMLNEQDGNKLQFRHIRKYNIETKKETLVLDKMTPEVNHGTPCFFNTSKSLFIFPVDSDNISKNILKINTKNNKLEEINLDGNCSYSKPLSVQI